MKKSWGIIVGLVLISIVSACSSDANILEELEQDEMISEMAVTDFLPLQVQMEFLTFEEAIQMSDVAIVGEYIETVQYEFYVEHKFKVKECLYGNIMEDEIYLYSNIGIGEVQDIDYTYELNSNEYEKGMNYILVMEKRESIFYEHDRYLLLSDLFMCEDTNTYSMYSQEIEIPGKTSIKKYICSVYDSVARESVVSNVVSYENEISEMIGESWYVGTVKILELVKEGKTRNSNSYRCIVESLSKGENLNTYDDGTIYMAILKDTVEVGEQYIIGFSPSVDENSLVYVQTTVTGVYDVSDEMLSEISHMLNGVE